MTDVRRTRRLALGVAAALTGLCAAAGAASQPTATAAAADPAWFGGRLLVTPDGERTYTALWDLPTDQQEPWRWQDGFGPGAFSHDGALFVRTAGQRGVELREQDGTTVDLGDFPQRQPELDELTSDLFIDHVGFVDSGDTVVGLLTADGTGEHYHEHPFVWRFERGGEPARVAYLGDYVESRVFWVTDPRSPHVYYSEPGDAGLGRVDVTTGAVEHLLDTALVPVALDAVGNRVLLSSRSGGELSWYDPADDSLAAWYDGPLTEDVVYEAVVTPDGTAVMIEAWDDATVEIRAIGDATLLHAFEKDWAAPGPAFLHGWQPCPDGTCPAYVPDQAPPAVPDVVVRSGRPDFPVTVRVGWTKLPDVLGGVVQYWVRASRWRDGTRVGTELFSYRHWIGHVAPVLRRGDYTVQVRARNYAGYGPWSEPSDVVRAR